MISLAAGQSHDRHVHVDIWQTISALFQSAENTLCPVITQSIALVPPVTEERLVFLVALGGIGAKAADLVSQQEIEIPVAAATAVERVPLAVIVNRTRIQQRTAPESAPAR